LPDDTKLPTIKSCPTIKSWQRQQIGCGDHHPLGTQ
jgi:hypothetical protein